MAIFYNLNSGPSGALLAFPLRLLPLSVFYRAEIKREFRHWRRCIKRLTVTVFTPDHECSLFCHIDVGMYQTFIRSLAGKNARDRIQVTDDVTYPKSPVPASRRL